MVAGDGVEPSINELMTLAVTDTTRLVERSGLEPTTNISVLASPTDSRHRTSISIHYLVIITNKILSCFHNQFYAKKPA
jgi:hypothetical protein